MERSVLARRVTPVAIFAAVLAVLVAVSLRGGGSPGSDGRLRPLPLGASSGTRAAGEGAPRAASDAMYYGGEIVIPDRLMTGLPTEGPVHNLARGDVSTDRIKALATALGVSGEVRTDSEGWVVGDGDVVVRVMKYAGTPWYLGPDKVVAERPVEGGGSSGSGGSVDGGVGVATAEPATTEPKPDPAPSGDDTPASPSDGCTEKECVDPVPPQSCPPPPDGTEPACVDPEPEPRPEPTKPPQPSDGEARAAAQKVFDALGLSGATITVNDAWSAKEVVAAPVVGGLPTAGFETRVSVELGGTIPYASGFLGTPEKEGDYPLLDPRESVERGGAWGPRIMSDSIGAPCAPEEPCPTPEPREATKVRLGLLFMASYDESQGAFLAPAWLLSFEGSTWEEPILALPDQYIATPPPSTDQPEPDVKPMPAEDQVITQELSSTTDPNAGRE